MIKNYQELQNICKIEKEKMDMRTDLANSKKEILICAGSGCLTSKSDQIAENLKSELKKVNLDNINVVKTGCFGFCEKGPIVKIMPDEVFYTKIKLEDINELVTTHFINNEIYEKRIYQDVKTKEKKIHTNEIDFYKKQNRVVLKNCGLIDPKNIHEYFGVDGYLALGKCLFELQGNEIIEIIKDSKLRGRGGGGFPTGTKWEIFAKQKNETKFVICNADEGDPGAFMDRSILEGNPHSVIEAMIINGYATDAKQGYVYVRAEYPVAVNILQKAIDDAYEHGFLGQGILGSSFNFDLEIRLGAGAFVCGEETALIASIESERGMPRNKPPFPAVSGLWNYPSNVNNVETYSNIPLIILYGSDQFKQYGTDTSKGTKVFALGGKVENSGLIEVELGTTLREVIYDIGGGIKNNREFKAVQTGGPSGGCLYSNELDSSIDFDTLVELGSMLGSGGMIVLDEDNCMVDVARFYLEFTVEESCGKCTPCREGTKRMLEILEKICDGEGTYALLEELEDLTEIIKESSLCGLGQTAPNPVISTLKHFREEYEEHINGKCRSGVCSNLTSYYITNDCIGCTKCARNCPVECITGDKKELHEINQSLCIKCGVCKNVCPVDSVIIK